MPTPTVPQLPQVVAEPTRIQRRYTLYVIYWPRHEILKVGVTNTSHRLLKHAQTGGELVSSVDYATTKQEREAIRHVAYAFDRAFATAAAAEPVLGEHGKGFTECFKVPRRHLLGAVELAFMGVRRGAHETN